MTDFDPYDPRRASDVSDDAPTISDFDAWMNGASLTQTSVDVLQRPDLLGRYQDWHRRWQRAKAGAGERSAAEKDPLLALEVEGEQLLDELEASRTTIYLRGLVSDDVEAIEAEFPEPPKPPIYEQLPPEPQRNPTEAQAVAYIRSHEAWQTRRDAFNTQHRAAQEAWAKATTEVLAMRGAEKLARAVVRIEQAGHVVATSMTVEQARRLPSVIGESQVALILDEIDRASNVAPEVPLGPLSRGSGGDQT